MHIRLLEQTKFPHTYNMMVANVHTPCETDVTQHRLIQIDPAIFGCHWASFHSQKKKKKKKN